MAKKTQKKTPQPSAPLGGGAPSAAAQRAVTAAPTDPTPTVVGKTRQSAPPQVPGGTGTAVSPPAGAVAPKAAVHGPESLSPATASAPGAAGRSASAGIPTVFHLHAPEAKGVSLCGGFNGWVPGATPLERKAEGRWEARVVLPPGRHEYKFVVDGQWTADPQAQEQVYNPHGSLNSVRWVRS